MLILFFNFQFDKYDLDPFEFGVEINNHVQINTLSNICLEFDPIFQAVYIMTNIILNGVRSTHHDSIYASRS